MLGAQLRSPRECPKEGISVGLRLLPGGRVTLYDAVALLHRHVDEALCEAVFRWKRKAERQRRWTLYLLVRFWTAVVVGAPESLTEVLEEGRREGDRLLPELPSSPEAFFRRCKSLSSRFFAELFVRFLARVVPEAAPCFARGLSALRERFPEVWVVDGSRLDAVAHKLKILRDVRSPVLGGSLIAFYDLFRGLPRVLRYDPDAASSEDVRAREALEEVPAGTLVVGDRLYGTVQFFAQLGERRLFGLVRRRRGVLLRRLAWIRYEIQDNRTVEDSLVEAGSGQGVPPQRLRRIRVRERGKVVCDLLTNVLDPSRLSVDEAAALYRKRWSIERMFFDLKEVLHLKRFYTSSPNGVAMQLYAAALVYTAFRVAQGKIALSIRRAPEEISSPKLFRKLAKASHAQAVGELTFAATEDANPGVHLRSPDWRTMKWSKVSLREILLRPRNGRRRIRRFCPSRRLWKSFTRVPGATHLIGS